MFTGLVSDVGVVERVSRGAMTDVWISSSYPGDFQHGESIACDGVCLTVVEFQKASFRVQAAPETLRRTALSAWAPGTKVNLERAMRLGDRFGGHWVQGHVDGVSRLVLRRLEGGSQVLRFSLPKELAPFLVEKGSICIDGVSLTVSEVGVDFFSVMVIPETQTHTTLGAKATGATVNLEVDIVGKYVARMLSVRGLSTPVFNEGQE